MKNKKIVSLVIAILTAVSLLITVYIKYKETGEIDVNKVKETITTIKDVVISEDTKELAIQTKEATNKNRMLGTKKIIESSIQEEQILEEEQLEIDAQVEQENISYDGGASGQGLNLLGKHQGLTYYSQADSRWANVMYSSVNNKKQTMRTSACGPTSAAMIVSASKGAILPTTMAKLSVDNGYRTVNSGTAWSFYSFVADYFDFREYYTTDNFNMAMSYLSQKKSDKSSKYYIIASCGNGLFTVGGHYIVLTGLDNKTLKVYDPYLYKGKFNTSSRKKANVKINGNIAEVSENNFKKYANYKRFWVFSNDEENDEKDNEAKKSPTIKNNTYTMYVNTSSKKLNIRNKPNGKIVGKISKGQKVTVYKTSGNWSKIGTNKWVSNDYLTSRKASSKNSAKTNSKNKYRIGKYKVTSNINVRRGSGTKYSKKTYKQLSANARKQNRKIGGEYNGYRKGVVCKVKKVSGNWGLTNSGWICLKYCKKIK